MTVHNSEHGDLTCTIGPNSPSTAGFHVGDLAGMGCKAGVLVIIVKSGSGTGARAQPERRAPAAPRDAGVDQTTRGTITALTAARSRFTTTSTET